MISKKQMAWINTRRIVTFMQNKHFNGYFTDMDFIRKTMCRNSFSSAHIFELAIPKICAFARPNPTRISFFKKCIESFTLIFSFLRGFASSRTRFRAIKAITDFYRRFPGHKITFTISAYRWDTSIFSHNNHYNAQITEVQQI